MFKQYLRYIKDNPHGYWFKRKLYGWGWVPVKWQGWLVVVIGIAILFAGLYIGEIDDAPGAALLGFILMIAFIFTFGYWKGEKPRWQGGLSGGAGTADDLYQCPECGFYYRDREWAKKCEMWCGEHKSCNLEITAHAEKSRS